MKKINKTVKGGLPPTPKINIEHIMPTIEEGHYPVKKVVGSTVTVEADIFKDGHDLLLAFVEYRIEGAKIWQRNPMYFWDNDRWKGDFKIEVLKNYEFTITAYVDTYSSWKTEVEKKFLAGQKDLESEILEGIALLTQAQKRIPKSYQGKISHFIATIKKLNISNAIPSILKDLDINNLLKEFPDPKWQTCYEKSFTIKACRKAVRFGAWYEMFARSQGVVPGQSSTFQDCIRRLDEIHDLGFDVVYLPPIHPIGFTKRKGKNNSLTAQPGEPGSPYAIGNQWGGHKAIEPGLGTLKDFQEFIDECHKRDMEIALDLALNCSPDHPYVKDHPDWFYKRPDGSIRYAENPPKKYEDIYPLNFYCQDWKNLWNEIKSIILFWAKKGVRIFRVDNPHTKPVPFWKWLIEKVQIQYPDMIFLSEAFTKPKMMKLLAKSGFDQSYTYFTWRNHKEELTEYLTELTQSSMKDYFTGNFFTNTPDILPFALQEGGRPIFKIRFILAATLSSAYGIYSGFELCENAAIPGKEEYLNSEKYEYKLWDWNRQGNIKDYIARVNHIRRTNSAFYEYDNLRFYSADNNRVLFYGKKSSDQKNIVFVIVNLDSYHVQQSYVEMPLQELGLADHAVYRVQDLITGEIYLWKGRRNFVVLDPHKEPAHILKIIG